MIKKFNKFFTDEKNRFGSKSEYIISSQVPGLYWVMLVDYYLLEYIRRLHALENIPFNITSPTELKTFICNFYRKEEKIKK